jgi:hypothetical protein
MRLLLILIFCIAAERVPAQLLTGRITDVHSGEPLAFVAVVEQGTTNGGYTDIDGMFRIRRPEEGRPVIFSYIGYHTLTMPWTGEDPWVVQMHPAAVTTAEVVIRPGENPAERIMRRVIAARDENNPEHRTSFSYDSYNKLVFTVSLDSASGQTAQPAIRDSARREMERYFSDKHLFIMESASTRRSMPPDRTEEIITANRVSGLRNPVFALLGTQIQSFSFYGKTVRIFDREYLSPLDDGAIRQYLFILEDTTLIDQDTVFTVSFRPRRDKNFDGMRGQLFVHTRGYALQHVLAEPAEDDVSFHVRIQQQYQLTDAGWFPDQLNSFLRFPQMKIEQSEVIGIGKSYITNLRTEKEYRRRDFGPVVLMMDPDAREQPDTVWQRLRVVPLDRKELNTYHVIDSVGEAENLDRRLEWLMMLGGGELPMGKLSLDLNRLFRFNNFEGWRLGAGLRTNDFLSKAFSVGGYYAYGFRDRMHKGGADLTFHLHRARNVKAVLSWQRDVQETGGRQLDPQAQGGLLSGDFYPLLISRMDQVEKRELTVSGRLAGNLSATAFANTQDIRPFRTIAQTSVRESGVAVELQDIAVAEAGLTMRWAPGERLVRTPRGEARLGGKYPVTHVRFSRGLDGVPGGRTSYTRLDAIVEKPFRFVHAGVLTLRLAGGWIPGNLPPSLLYNVRGTNTVDYNGNTFIGVASPYSFETMRTNEFMLSRYAALHIRHQFRDLLLRAGNFRPYLSIVHNMLIGDRQGTSAYLFESREAERVFMESGLVLDRLLISSFSGIGLGFFYRYGEQAFAKAADNFAAKISATIVF